MLDAQSDVASALGGMSGPGQSADQGQAGLDADTGGFAELLSGVLAAPSSGALLLANAKTSAKSAPSPTSPPPAGLKLASAQTAATLLLATPLETGGATLPADGTTSGPAANDTGLEPPKAKDGASDSDGAPAPNTMADAMAPAAATLQLLASLVSTAPAPSAPAQTSPKTPASGQSAPPSVEPSSGARGAPPPALPDVQASSAVATNPNAAGAVAAPPSALPPSVPVLTNAPTTSPATPVVVQSAPASPAPTPPVLADASGVQLAAQAPLPAAAAAPPPPVPTPAPALQESPPPDATPVALTASAPPPILAAAAASASVPPPIAQTRAAASSAGPQSASAISDAAAPPVAQVAAGAESDGARQDGSGERPHEDHTQAAPAAPQASDPAAAGALASVAPAAGLQAPSQSATVNAQTVSRLAAGIVQNLKSKASRFQLALDPAGLGRVDISVRIGADGALSATLNFNSAQAADALKAHAGELRAALEQAGFNLGGSDLSFMTGNSGQQSGGSQGQPAGRLGFASAALSDPEPQAPSSAPISQTVGSGADGLDIRI